MAKNESKKQMYIPKLGSAYSLASLMPFFGLISDISASGWSTLFDQYLYHVFALTLLLLRRAV